MNTILGSIVGDTVGSVYEFAPVKDYNFDILLPAMRYTDDSIMTVAVADWILSDRSHSHEALINKMRHYGRLEPSPMGGYGSGFRCWLRSACPKPYDSWGNGAAMRVSAVGYAFSTMEETLRVAKTSAEVTHNHPEGIKGAQATAAAIYIARNGGTKSDIKEYVADCFHYDLDRHYDAIQPSYAYCPSCQGTVPESLIAFLESDSYEDAIRKAIALGGDADTMGSITGGIASAFYREIPQSLASYALGQLPEHLRTVVESFEEEYAL